MLTRKSASADVQIAIYGASTLSKFTTEISSGFTQLGAQVLEDAIDSAGQADLTLIQIHGSPSARAEDIQLLEKVNSIKASKAILIHRPDELLLNPDLLNYFEANPEVRLIFLGDLIFRFSFWEKRRPFSAVIPHPYFSFDLPENSARPIVGAFTSWGEMRNVKHYLALIEHLKDSDVFEFRIGGSGLENVALPSYVQLATTPFIPHFNVQLYHLEGKKRYGESSGSLHSGASIPVIFEANGAERIEGIHAVKIVADDELHSIDFAQAAEKIVTIAGDVMSSLLADNQLAAQRNTVQDFATSVVKFYFQTGSKPKAAREPT